MAGLVKGIEKARKGLKGQTKRRDANMMKILEENLKQYVSVQYYHQVQALPDLRSI
jgi:hypothetical protein